MPRRVSDVWCQDLAKKKIINCWYVKTLVLDEADVMLSEAWIHLDFPDS